MLEDGDAVIWESDARQIDVVRWLSWNQAHLNRFAGMGAPDAAKVADATIQFAVFARVLDEYLAGRDWLVGGSLSLVDFAMSAAFPWAAVAKLPLADFPAVRPWATYRRGETPYPEPVSDGSVAT